MRVDPRRERVDPNLEKLRKLNDAPTPTKSSKDNEAPLQ